MLIHDIIKMLKINRRELNGNTKFETAYPGLKRKINIVILYHTYNKCI